MPHTSLRNTRAFLYAKGGINRCAKLYREEFAHQDEVEEDEPYGPSMISTKTRFTMPVGMQRLHD